jgi:hypothetical protein
MRRISFLFLLLFASCGKQAKLDSVKLESLLSGGQIDRVEIIIPFGRTNILTGAAAQRYALSLRETNRIAEADTTKAQVASEVGLMSGTNELSWLWEFDNGLWKYGDYSFRLRTSP